MRVIGIDPGYDRIGVAVMEKNSHKQEVLLFSECIETEKKAELSDRLLSLGRRFDRLLKQYQPDVVAIETLFFNKNQKTAMAVAEARGMMVYLAKEHNCRLMELGPKEVKVAITGYGSSDKRSVTDMLTRLIPDLPTKALDDEYDAIAIAVTALAHHR